MKKQFQILLVASLLMGSPMLRANARSKPAHASSRTQNVAVIIYPGVEALDLSGPLDVFTKANLIVPDAFNLYTVGLNHASIQTEEGALSLTPKFDIANCPRPDIVIVPGASPERVLQMGTVKSLQNWLRHNAAPNQTIMSVCTGAFILGRAGLLNGKNSTTHYLALNDLQQQFPKTKAFSGVRFIRDGNLLCAAGVSSGIDGALQLVELSKGKSTADKVANVLQYRRGTPVFPAQSYARVRVQTASTSPASNSKFALALDPVCHMKIGAQTTNTARFNGKIYGFCSSGCRNTFAAHPEHFLKTK